jgi:hypothetical protein
MIISAMVITAAAGESSPEKHVLQSKPITTVTQSRIDGLITIVALNQLEHSCWMVVD